MSTYYKEKNSESAKELFWKRTVYNAELSSYRATYANLVDFNQGEKFLYGRVDRNFVPFAMGTDENIKAFQKTTPAGSQSGITALNFVVDAFNDLSLQFEKCALTNKIDPNDKYLSTLTVHRAYQDPQSMYRKYKNAYFVGIANMFRKSKIKIRNFEEFIFQLMKSLEVSAPTVPFTFPSFVKSRRCPINVSGLAVEIAAIDAGNDDEKINLFTKSKNWEFYLNACRTYGFMVDQMAPWRLVADIGSSAMIKYATKYGINQTDVVFFRNYRPCHATYADLFVDDLLTLYNMCVKKTITESQECNGKITTKVTQLPTYTSLDLYRKFGGRYFTKLYCRIRFFEEETTYTENQKNKILRDLLGKSKQMGTSRSMIYFERIINKPFDYRGSITYNNTKHIPALQEAQAEEEGLLSSRNGSGGMDSGGGY
tara:strand:- start:27 stop:1304 length:1278 start_codon:yes stop_codon:yes gene_type:complete